MIFIRMLGGIFTWQATPLSATSGNWVAIEVGQNSLWSTTTTVSNGTWVDLNTQQQADWG